MKEFEYAVFCFLQDGTNNWKRFPITKEHFELFKHAHFFCVHALEIEEAFALLVRGFLEFENELLRQAQRSMVWLSNTHENAMDNKLELNFRLVSFLTLTQLYDDITKRLVKEMFGKQSTNQEILCALKRTLRDSKPCYRFLEDLRDFSQHIALPFDTMCTSPRIRVLRSPETEQIIVPKIDKKRFKDRNGYYDLNGIETDKDGKIDVRKPLRESLLCVYQIHSEFRKMTDALMPAQREQLIQTKNNYFLRDGISYNPMDLRCLDNGKVVESVSTFTKFLDLYDSHRKMNVLNDKLPLSCASNYIN